ncbi:MAG: oligosaccharide flippase family protein [Candidatus Micrarchaeaceae archaeon]
MNEEIAYGSRAAEFGVTISITGIASTLIYGIIFIIMTRILGPENYGIYAIALGFSGLAGSVGGFGIGTFMNREAARRNGEKVNRLSYVIGTSLLLLFGFDIILSLVFFFISPIAASIIFKKSAYSIVLYVSSISIFANVACTAFLHGLIGYGDKKGYVISSLSLSIFQSIFSLLLILLGYGYLGAIAGYVVGIYVSFFISLYFIITRFHPRVKEFRNYAKRITSFSMPIMLNNILGGIAPNITLLLIGFLLGNASAGYYSIANKVFYLLSIFLAGISLSSLPLFSSLEKRRSANLQKAVYYSILLSATLVLPFSAYLSVFSKQIVAILFPSYVESYKLLFIAGPALFLQILVISFSNILYAKGNTKGAFRATLSSVVVSLALLYPMLLLYGDEGAMADMFIISQLTYVLSSYRFVSEELREVIRRIGNFKGVAISNVIMGLLFRIELLFPIHWSIALFIGLLLIIFLYPILLPVFGTLTDGERSAVHSILRGSKNMRLVRILLIDAPDKLLGIEER